MYLLSMSELPRGSCIIPDVVDRHGVWSLEEIGTTTATMKTWKVSTLRGGSFLIRNFLWGSLCTGSSVEYIVSKMNLGPYGPPQYVYKGRYSRNGKVVQVEARKYAEGATLRELMETRQLNIVSNIMRNIDLLFEAHSRLESDIYGITNVIRGLPCSFKDYIGRDISTDRFVPRCRQKAMLCHNNVNPDHIIIEDGRISSIVGWSLADITHPAVQVASYLSAERSCEVGDLDILRTMRISVIRTMVNPKDRWKDMIMRSCSVEST